MRDVLQVLRSGLREGHGGGFQGGRRDIFRSVVQRFIRTGPDRRCTGRTVIVVGHFRVAWRCRGVQARKDTTITVAAVLAGRKCGGALPTFKGMCPQTAKDFWRIPANICAIQRRRAAFLPRAIFASACAYAFMVSGTAWLYTNCPSRRQAIKPASLRILRWWETVAGVTPRIETMLLHVMCSVAEMASKILRRVSSARAFDIFSISARSMEYSKCSEIIPSCASRNSLHPGINSGNTCILSFR